MENKRNPTITNCEFKFKCPKKWDDLVITEDQKVRHCQQCNQSVTLCTSRKEIERLTSKGECIAIDIVTKSRDINRIDNTRIISRTIGLPLPKKNK